MARPPKGKPLTMRTMRLDDDVWAECQRLGKVHGTINEGLRMRLFERSAIPLPVLDGLVNQGRGNQNPDEPLAKVVTVTKELKRQTWKRGPRPKGDKTR